MPVSSNYQSEPAILALGETYFDAVEPADFPKRIQRFINLEWAKRVGLGELTPAEWENHFAKFQPLPKNLEKPLALRYHGHQFRSYNPDLGDGRGFLFAQLRDDKNRLLDFGTKGSGQTPYSRRGDGRLTLKGAVREALATEMLESLGVNTSKTFAFFETGESLQRNDEPSPTRAAVLTRLSHSHVRFGTFQRFHALKDYESIKKLIDYCGTHFYPQILEATPEKRPAALLREVAKRVADLCASWMVGGFVHGVLNTDNMNITGESFDYGPYRFLPKYDPDFTAAYFDQEGLYSYGRQPEAAIWNLERLAECFVPICEKDLLIEALKPYPDEFNAAAARKVRERLGLKAKTAGDEEALIMSSFNFLANSQITYEQFFHDWFGGEISSIRAEDSPEAKLYEGEHYDSFRAELRGWQPELKTIERLNEGYFSQEKPCTLLIDEIEWIWDSIAKDDDWSRFEKKIEDIREMGRAYGRR